MNRFREIKKNSFNEYDYILNYFYRLKEFTQFGIGQEIKI